MSNLQALPEALLNHVFRYVEDTATLLNLERICKSFKIVAQDDTLWNVKSLDGRFASRREQACVELHIKRVETCQKTAENVLKPFGDSPFAVWRGIILQALRYEDMHGANHRCGIRLRSVVEILEQLLVCSFQRA